MPDKANGDLHGQYLHVTISVPTSGSQKFVGYMKDLMPTFTGPVPPKGEITGFAWDLTAAMTQEQGDVARFRHLWRMTDPGRPLLWEAMAQLGTEDSYGDLDGLVDIEVQHIMHTDRDYSPRVAPEHAAKFYAHEFFELPREPGYVTKYVWGMPGVANAASEEVGWQLLLGLEAATGKLRRYANVWQVEEIDTKAIKKATAWLNQQEVYQKVSGQEVDAWTALTY